MTAFFSVPHPETSNGLLTVMALADIVGVIEGDVEGETKIFHLLIKDFYSLGSEKDL